MILVLVLNSQSLWQEYHPGIDYTPKAAVRIISQGVIYRYGGSQYLCSHVGSVEFHVFFAFKNQVFRRYPSSVAAALGLVFCCWEGVGRFGWGGPFNDQVGSPIVAQKLRKFSFSKYTKKTCLAGWVAVSTVFF